MYSIYKIRNKINDKLYIGQTTFDIEKRFKEHVNRAKNELDINRPIYNAMRKYGIENFYIELVETNLTKNQANERERYWISYYDTFYGNGYNATEGGDNGATHSLSVIQIDMDTLEVIHIFKSTHDAARYFGKNNAPINRVCLGQRNSSYGYYWCYEYNYETYIEKIKEQKETKKEDKKVNQIDIHTNKIIGTYSSTWMAEKELNVTHGHIKRVCENKRNTFHGYRWEYAGQAI